MSDDRLLRVLRAIVREMLPRHDFLGKYRYRVLAMAGDRVDLQAVRKGAGLPDILPMPIAAGMAGLSAELTPGALVLVEFIEGDPQLPVVTGFSRDGGSTFLPVSLLVDAIDTVRIGAEAGAVDLGAATAVVVRDGDLVNIAGVQPGPGVVAVRLSLVPPPAQVLSKVRA
ncbi:hypothetical protein [Sorangium sp. So ce117]|uniref:hypothetical protein n=1 Tax=Sorangium sp. So ce117 TaxID=3133277 RepID=UPI003F60A38F